LPERLAALPGARQPCRVETVWSLRTRDRRGWARWPDPGYGDRTCRSTDGAIRHSLRTRGSGSQTPERSDRAWTLLDGVFGRCSTANRRSRGRWGEAARLARERAESIRRSLRARRSGQRTPNEATEHGRCWMESSDDVRRPTGEVVEFGARWPDQRERGPSHFGRSSEAGRSGQQTPE
jgi:hypothetical protein